MAQVNLKDNEYLDRALRLFKKNVERERLKRQIKERRHYEKPSDRKRRKLRSSRSRSQA